MKFVYHAQHTSMDWFNFNWKPERVFPVVMEKGLPSIDDQTDDAMHWLFNQTHFEDARSFKKRILYVRQRPLPQKNQHSSGATKKSLTPDAERCLESYYKEEYDFFGEIIEKVCKTEVCRQALQSIIDRRT